MDVNSLDKLLVFDILTRLAMRFSAIILILCVVPCLFIIPVLCGPVELALSEEEDFCFLMTFEITSDTLILAESITYQSIPKGFTLLKDIPEFFNIPIVFFEKDRPPAFLIPAFN